VEGGGKRIKNVPFSLLPYVTRALDILSGMMAAPLAIKRGHRPDLVLKFVACIFAAIGTLDTQRFRAQTESAMM